MYVFYCNCFFFKLIGEDEFDCHNRTCAGQLRCRGDSICVHMINICDNVIQCTTWADDELYCSTTGCPDQCVCQGNSLRCTEPLPNPITYFTTDIRNIILYDMFIADSDIFTYPIYLAHLEFHKCSFSNNILEVKVFIGIYFLERLIFKNISISSISSFVFQDMDRLSTILIQHSTIVTLKEFTFDGLKSIRTLNLSHLNISHIDNCAFCIAERLQQVNLSYNNLEMLNERIFAGIPSISVVDLRHNPIQFIQVDAVILHYTNIYFTLSYYCCYTIDISNCITLNTLTKKYDLCKTIFKNIKLEIFSLIIAIIACVLNIAAITSQENATEYKAHYTLTKKRFISNISLAVYYYSLLSVSLLYRNNYIFYETQWISNNIFCSLLRCYILSTIFVSKTIGLLIAVNQLIATKYALKFDPLTSLQCNVCIILALMLMAVYSTILMVFDKSLHRDLYCFPFYINSLNWKAAMYFIYFMTLLLFVLAIMIIYIRIIAHVKLSHKNVSSTMNFDATLRRIRNNMCLTVLIELFTSIVLVIAAIIHNTDGINSRVQLFSILSTIYLQSSINAVHYFARNFVKYRKCQHS